MNTSQTFSDASSISISLDRPRTQKKGVRVSLVAAMVGLALVVSGCTGGPGTQAEFVEVLMLNDNFNEVQADCIAEAVFDEYGEDNDALQKISGAESYEYLLGEDGVDGFGPFFDDVVTGCVTAGPSPSDG